MKPVRHHGSVWQWCCRVPHALPYAAAQAVALRPPLATSPPACGALASTWPRASACAERRPPPPIILMAPPRHGVPCHHGALVPRAALGPPRVCGLAAAGPSASAWPYAGFALNAEPSRAPHRWSMRLVVCAAVEWSA
ncbi:hypothetical protein C2845_PM06G25950 [Panicum miliaceum]|uniref:Uncharacterized protein n=1 Tax=Panicum miliaceum TaxID=4540 RepID=A0A3L6R744_PANMI|nr:hypothetical protein C2845_PM06G25950 [Panicum miliaceum]